MAATEPLTPITMRGFHIFIPQSLLGYTSKGAKEEREEASSGLYRCICNRTDGAVANDAICHFCATAEQTRLLNECLAELVRRAPIRYPSKDRFTISADDYDDAEGLSSCGAEMEGSTAADEAEDDSSAMTAGSATATAAAARCSALSLRRILQGSGDGWAALRDSATRCSDRCSGVTAHRAAALCVAAVLVGFAFTRHQVQNII